ncbi:23S rRNA (uracil(747)-C(5))-methyltransferase RlmC [Zhihengliuella flava]|uniref:23S rRNA (Uracil747-C5)-methyltransferase n=1 Tax=Zhihengliuella flava TaxID=1285193 RepID=A0A931D7W0_9MICC|nr:23S rRNA (uracil(747)-C(5))-methyltransferase RlmC [Zhihengliuella flava]MBG6084037.1 23S rRNA (uracil747-C5)-methyltransferase [Zhihengliuella flava]
MHCDYYDAGRCTSCAHMGQEHLQQVAEKVAQCQQLLAEFDGIDWVEPFAGAEAGFRNKAKMVVSGTTRRPRIGILDAEGHGIDLRRCGLITPGLQEALRVLSNLIRAARLTPYDVPSRQGELKYLLVTEAPSGELMVRFVLRSEALVPTLREHLPGLADRLPTLRVASVNLQPEHKAVLEGEREIPLTAAQSLTMEINGIGLHLRPGGFFQTNTEVAAALYRQGAAWASAAGPASVWDLYCGVGGFALHLAEGFGAGHVTGAGPDAVARQVTGIEVSQDAVASAELTRAERGLTGVDFVCADATEFALGSDPADHPDLLVVNPPRRGVGARLCEWMENSRIQHVLYSSCNAVTLAADLRRMPSLRPVKARVMDMFPQSTHYEVITLLTRV